MRKLRRRGMRRSMGGILRRWSRDAESVGFEPAILMMWRDAVWSSVGCRYVDGYECMLIIVQLSLFCGPTWKACTSTKFVQRSPRSSLSALSSQNLTSPSVPVLLIFLS